MLPQVMSAKQSVQRDRRARAKLRRGLKAKVTALEAETTDTGSASDESGHEVPQMDLLWPSQPLPPGELRRVQDCPASHQDKSFVRAKGTYRLAAWTRSKRLRRSKTQKLRRIVRRKALDFSDARRRRLLELAHR